MIAEGEIRRLAANGQVDPMVLNLDYSLARLFAHCRAGQRLGPPRARAIAQFVDVVASPSVQLVTTAIARITITKAEGAVRTLRVVRGPVPEPPAEAIADHAVLGHGTQRVE